MKELFKGYNPLKYFTKSKTKDDYCHIRYNCSGYGEMCNKCKWTEFRKELKQITKIGRISK